MRAVTLLSGGLDSVVATWAARRDYEIALALTYDYGQRAAVREISAARQVAERVACRHEVVALPWLGALGGNALTDPARPVPAVQPVQLGDVSHTQQTAAAVWVPNRNGVFLNIAAAYAEALDCAAIVCGFNAEEARTFPDNSAPFMMATSRCFELSTRNHPVVVSPTARYAKAEIVALGWELAAPLEFVWSCYHGGARHCWSCESCQRLRRALEHLNRWHEWCARAGET